MIAGGATATPFPFVPTVDFDCLPLGLGAGTAITGTVVEAARGCFFPVVGIASVGTAVAGVVDEEEGRLSSPSSSCPIVQTHLLFFSLLFPPFFLMPPVEVGDKADEEEVVGVLALMSAMRRRISSNGPGVCPPSRVRLE